MNPNVYSSQRDKVISGAGAFGMHLLFIALLVFGVNWQKKVEPQANIVDLWANLPSVAQPKVEPAPPPPPPPQPVMPPKIAPATPPKVVAKPDIAKPDIALKEKAEKDRRMLDQKKADTKKQEDLHKAAEQKERLAKEAPDAQRAKSQQEEDAKRKQAEQVAAARKAQIAKYEAAIRDKIRRSIVMPPSVQGNPEAEFEVVILEGGNVLNAKLKRSSGNAAYDSAVERAILGAQPLPVPPDPALFKEFRELNLRFRPQE